ncbi:MAG: zf-HC2 domain-containing protein [Bacillota bacterium]
MCYDEGRIQSYIDGELEGSEMDEIQEHLEICRECRVVYDRLLENDMLVRNSMAGFIASDRERFDAEKAWRKLKLENAAQEEIPKGKWQFDMMLKKVATAAAAVALVGLLAFSPVSGMASDFLTIFRVEKVKVISITPEEMAQMDKLMREGAGGVNIKNFGKIEVRGKQEEKPVTVEEAGKSIDFDLKIPAVAGYSKPELKKLSGFSVTLTLDVNNVNSVLKSLGSGERLPDELNGKEFTLEVPPAIIADYSGAAGKIVLSQSRGPSVRTSAGVDVKAIRQALLSIPALPESLRRQLAAVDDWQHTAMIPLKSGQYTEVTVNGAGGVFIRGDGGQNSAGVLVWQKNGVIYVLAGDSVKLDRALDIAGKMK